MNDLTSIDNPDLKIIKGCINARPSNLVQEKSSAKVKMKNNLNSCTGISKEKQNNSRYCRLSPHVKIVNSKYKQAAAEFGQKSQSNNSGSISSHSLHSSNGNDSGNHTVASRPPVTGLKAFAASTDTVNKLDPLPSRLKFPAFSLNRKSPASRPKPKKIKPKKTSAKLHSTAIYNDTVFEDPRCDSSECFSTTVVAGGPKRTFSSTIPDIDDISTIRSDGSFFQTPKGKSTMPVAKEVEDPFPEDFSESEIELAYLEYLMLTHINLDQTIKMQNDERDMKSQVMFSAALLQKEREKLLKNNKLSALIEHHDKVNVQYSPLRDTLQNLNETIISTEDDLETLSSNLESKLNEIKIKNIHLPTEHNEELCQLIDENCRLKRDINENIDWKRRTSESMAALFTSLAEGSQVIHPCLREVEKAACFTIQEASLNLSLAAMKGENQDSTVEDH